MAPLKQIDDNKKYNSLPFSRPFWQFSLCSLLRGGGVRKAESPEKSETLETLERGGKCYIKNYPFFNIALLNFKFYRASC